MRSAICAAPLLERGRMITLYDTPLVIPAAVATVAATLAQATAAA